MLDPSPEIQSCVDFLSAATSVVVSTGAGMSKESGIPTFRDAPNSLWAKYDPEKLATREGFAADPPLVWRWYDERREMISGAEPNDGHRAISQLESRFRDFTVVTQNIDDLHRKAGSKNIVELHGNIFRYKCFGHNHAIEDLPDDDHVPPRCHCGSFIRPDVVWFGEMLPEQAIEDAHAALSRCDFMLVVGTSGMVYPAAGFPAVARQAGARVVEINPEPSSLTPEVDLFIQGPAGKVLPSLVSHLESTG